MEEDERRAKEVGAVMYAAHQLTDRASIIDGVDKRANIIGMIAPKAGAVKYTRPNTGECVIVEPRDPMFSTAVMMAEEYWTGEKWIKAGELDGCDSEFDAE